MELDELKKMKETVEGAARDVQSSVHTATSDFEKDWAATTSGLSPDGTASHSTTAESFVQYPEYKHPKKHWRVKQGAMPQWYKARAGVRTKALSGAARVARFRPQKFN